MRTYQRVRHHAAPFELNRDCDEAVGLVGWWPLGAYPDGRDMSIRGNHGRLINGPVASGAGNRLGLKFDGVDDYVDVGNQSLLNLTSPNLTIAAWASRTDASKYLVPMTRRLSNNLQYQLTWVKNNEGVHNDKVRLDLGLGSGIVSFNTTNAHASTGWHHISATYDGANVRLYFDGVSDGTTAETRSIDSYAVSNFIGQDNASVSTFSSGLLDDVRIYNRALSAAQVQKMFLDGLSGRYGPLARVRRRWWAVGAAAPSAAARYLNLLGVGA